MAEVNELDISNLTLEDKLTQCDLFGGAITISIPSQWRDVSEVRQVPDHQEVYQDCTIISSNNQNTNPNDSLQGTGGCIIIEILERQDDISDNDAATFFFNDLADANIGETTTTDSNTTTGEDNPAKRLIQYSHVWNVGKSSSISGMISSEEKGDDRNKFNLMPNLNACFKACSCIGRQSIGPLRNKQKVEEGKASEVVIELCVLRLEAVQTDLLISLSMPIFLKGKVGKKDERRKGHSELFLSILKSFNVTDWSLFC